MKLIFVIVSIAVVTAFLFYVYPRINLASAPVHVQSQGPTVERLQRLSQLVTLQVMVADVLVGEGEGSRGSWLIKGDALLGTDLAKAQIVDRDDTARRATLLLPSPVVLHSRVDHQRTRTWEVRRMAWMPWNADQDRLRDAVMLQAQELVTHVAGSSENIRQTKTNTETTIKTLYGEVGWQVSVQWTPDSGSQP